MLLTLLLLAAQPQDDSTAERSALAMQVARSGMLAQLLPMMEADEVARMLADHPDLTAAERTRLAAIAREQAAASAERLFAAEAAVFAERLSVEELRAALAWNASAPARRLREAMPAAVTAVVKTKDGIDYRGDVLARMCRETGKACAKP